jgi:hypothetical protein
MHCQGVRFLYLYDLLAYFVILEYIVRDHCRIVAGSFILFLGDISGLTHACFWPIELLQEAY